jgi:hypothetical protein
MARTFEKGCHLIIYTFEKMITHVRNSQYIFLAQSVLWIASVLGLQLGSVIHIDNLRIWSALLNLDDHRLCVPSDAEFEVREEPCIASNSNSDQHYNNRFKKAEEFPWPSVQSRERIDLLPRTRQGKLIEKKQLAKGERKWLTKISQLSRGQIRNILCE